MKLRSIKTQKRIGGMAMLLAALPGLSLSAQSHVKDTTVNRTVVVEQQYNPNIMDAQKVNVLPEMREFTTTPNEVEYDKNVAPATVLPGSAMAAYAGEERQYNARQGYARLGYGNVGNLDVEGNYLFTLSPRDKLNLSLGVQGMDGKVDYILTDGEWDSRFYRTKAGVDYMHQFNKVELDISGNFGLSNFNYYPEALINRQKFTSGDVRFGVKSTDPTLPMRFNVETGILLYSRAYNLFAPNFDDAFNETIIRTKGDFTGDVADNQQIGVAFEMNNLFYNEDFFKNYTSLLLNPYYELSEEDSWKLHFGVNVDLAFSHGKKFRISPDVTGEYIFSDSYVLYASATGGKALNDYRRLERLNPYGEIFEQYEDSYEQLNTMAGFKMSPATGLWINLYGGYQLIKDDLVDDVAISKTDPLIAAVSFFNEETKNFYAGIQANYAYKDQFTLMARTQYYKWDADNLYALHFKPRFRADFQVGFRPVTALGINVGYEFAQREKVNEGYREKNISNLNLSATYDLFKGVAMYARFSNILNTKYQYYSLSPMPGFNFVGGLIFSF